MDKTQFFIIGYSIERKNYNSPIEINFKGYIGDDFTDWNKTYEIMNGLEHGTIKMYFEKVEGK